jgi:hypothetical protein
MGRFESDERPGMIRYGPGSVSLNLFAWIDAFQAAILTRHVVAAAGDKA